MKRIVSLMFALLVSASLTVSAVAADKAAKADAGKKAKVEEKTAAAAAKQEALDINTATEAELKALPGIGDAYAKKIVAGRPYASKDQLVAKKVIPKATYEKIKDKIVAKQAKK